MIIRTIRENELKRCEELFCLAFEFPMERPERTPEEVVRAARESPRSWEDVHWDWRWAAFEDDDTTMMAKFAAIPWRANFDGHEIGMAGIGGVASLPQYRRSGAIRGCFEAALPELYRRGMALSYLYPFSTAFYRRFGYETACEAILWRVELSHLPETPGGAWRLSEPGQRLTEAIAAVDALRQHRYNCMVLRGDTEYRWTAENPFVTRDYTYVWYDDAGAPRSYATLSPGPGRELTCKRFVFSDARSLMALLELLRRFAADHSHARMALPCDVDLRGLLPEFSLGRIERSVLSQGMARAIDVAALLRMARARGEGALNVAVRDGQIPENDGTFRVTFTPGRENAVTRTDGAPDIELTVQDFTRLILGCCDAPDPMWLPNLRLHCPVERAAQLFYRKPAFIEQAF